MHHLTAKNRDIKHHRRPVRNNFYIEPRPVQRLSQAALEQDFDNGELTYINLHRHRPLKNIDTPLYLGDRHTEKINPQEDIEADYYEEDEEVVIYTTSPFKKKIQMLLLVYVFGFLSGAIVVIWLFSTIVR